MPDPTFLTRDGGDPVADFQSFVDRVYHPSEESLMTAGLIVRQQIREQALAGVSFTGTPFAPYSPDYERRKGQQNVDLYSKEMRPHMLDALDVRVSTNPPEIEIGIFGDDELALRARVNNEGGTVRTSAGKIAGRYTSLKARRAAVALGRSLYARIPARPWLGATQESLDRAGASLAQDIGRN